MVAALLWTLFLSIAIDLPHADARPVDELASRDSSASSGCFPAVGFQMPSSVPSSTTNWWCNPSSEYAFLGFSYEVTACPSLSQLKHDFTNIRNTFHGRYVRLYGTCDRGGFYNDIVEAAWQAGIGIHALIWFGFDGSDRWKSRRDALISTLHSNPKAKFVTRAVQFGSEPLFDEVLSAHDVANQVYSIRASLSSLNIPVTVSELAYGYQAHDTRHEVLNAVDVIDAHMLPFFSFKATVAKSSWDIVLGDLNWFVQNGNGKKIYLTENGWPSTTYSGVEPNNHNAVANVQNERDYFNLLDSKCSYFKYVAGGGVGWFAHLYSDSMEPGYGIYNTNGVLKFPFSPRTSC